MAPDAPVWLREVPAVTLLRQVWVQTFCLVPTEASAGGGASAAGSDSVRVCWRTSEEGVPPALLRIASPYDPDMHVAQKRSTTWIGYKVHVTETCDAERPHLVTHVETTPAPIVDRDTLSRCMGPWPLRICCRARIWSMPGMWIRNTWWPASATTV